jgi:hypothetical protein
MFLFIDHFRAIACNFRWNNFSNGTVFAWRDGRYFDPITAFVWISKGLYLDRHEVHKAADHLKMSKSDFDNLLKCLHNRDYTNKEQGQLRREIEIACGVLKEEVV